MAKQVIVNFVGNAGPLKRTTQEVSGALGNFQSKVANVGSQLKTFAADKAVDFLKGAASSAVEHRKSLSLLEQQIKSATGVQRVNMSAVEKWITSQRNASAFLRTDVQNTYGKFINVLHDTKKAQEVTAFATDLARSHNVDLWTATNALLGAETGRVKALNKMGIVTKDASGKVMTLTQIMERNKGSVQGAARAYADGAGKSDRMKDSLHDFSVSVGNVLLPIMDKLTAVFMTLSSWYLNLSEGNRKMVVIMATVVGAVVAVVLAGGKLIKLFQAIKVASAFLAANPWVIALALVVGAIILVIKHFDKIKTAAKATWDFMKDVFKTGINFIIGLLNVWIARMLMPFKPLSWIPGPQQKWLKAIADFHIPSMDTGGIVPGARGMPSLIMAHGGETVLPTHKGGGGAIELHIHIGPRELVKVIRSEMLKTGRSNVSVGLA